MNAGWVLTVMGERGIHQPDRELLRQALGSMGTDAEQALSASVKRLQSGGDDAADMERVAVVGRALSERTRNALASVGLPWVPGAVLRWAVLTRTWEEQLKRAVADGDAEAKGNLRMALAAGAQDEDRVAEGEVRSPAPASSMPETTTETAPRANDEAPPRRAKPRRDEAPAETDKERWSHHVYGAKAALTIQIDVARAREGLGREHTLRIEAAKALGNGSENGERRYAWADKLVFQLTHNELHQAAAVLLGLREKCEFSGHGAEKDKRCSLQVQQGGVFAKLARTGELIAVPIGQDDLYDVALLAVRALGLNDPDIDHRSIIDLLRLTARLAKAT